VHKIKKKDVTHFHQYIGACLSLPSINWLGLTVDKATEAGTGSMCQYCVLTGDLELV